MKAAITTLNGRTILDGRNIRSIDIRACRDMVLSRMPYEQVDYVNIPKKNSKPSDPENQPYFKSYEYTSLNEYDHVYVYNYTANFFGGSVQPHVIKQLKELSSYSGTLFYIQTDPELHLVNLASVIFNALQRGRQLVFSTEERLTVDDVQRHQRLRWNLLYNGANVARYLHRYTQKIKESDRYEIQSFEYVDFFEKLYASLDLNLSRNLELHERTFDLVYYGNWRSERENLFKKYFIGNNLSNLLIGIKPNHLKKYAVENCTFNDYVPHSQLGNEVNKAIASVVIGDPTHCVSQIKTARFFENIKSNVVSFIDINYDPDKKLYSDPRLQHLYVNDIKDVKTKLQKIKNNPELFKAIITLQHNELKRYQ